VAALAVIAKASGESLNTDLPFVTKFARTGYAAT
jgi:hypothetical protein